MSLWKSTTLPGRNARKAASRWSSSARLTWRRVIAARSKRKRRPLSGYDGDVPPSSAVALTSIAAFGVFIAVGGNLGALVLLLGGVALLVASILSSREPHSAYTEGPLPYPHAMWRWGSLAVGLLWIAIAAAELL
jgi:hypothetical protein